MEEIAVKEVVLVVVGEVVSFVEADDSRVVGVLTVFEVEDELAIVIVSILMISYSMTFLLTGRIASRKALRVVLISIFASPTSSTSCWSSISETTAYCCQRNSHSMVGSLYIAHMESAGQTQQSLLQYLRMMRSSFCLLGCLVLGSQLWLGK